MRYRLIIIIGLIMAYFCSAGQINVQKKMNNESSKSNPLFCDPVEGICEMPESGEKASSPAVKSEKGIKVIYFTDPICSSCWGIEPQLRKLKLEYGSFLTIEYRMGGLLPDWSYNSGGISKPSDVAHHWDEVSVHYDMPIDGDVWLEDPLNSSYPPSIAFKAAQIQGEEVAVRFLRILREMVFLQKKNITKWEHIAEAGKLAGLDVFKLKSDYEGTAKILFEEDLKLAKENGVRGFPTFFFTDGEGNRETVYGTKPYAFYEMAVLKLNPSLVKKEYEKDQKNLFSKYASLTAKEYAELSGVPRKESERLLNELSDKGELQKLSTKNGALWSVK